MDQVEEAPELPARCRGVISLITSPRRRRARRTDWSCRGGGSRGALSDSTIDGLYIHHTKVGIWLDGPMNNVTISNMVIADQIADGVNFHGGVTNSKVVNSLIRNTADDGLAMWSAPDENANNVFDHNTVMNNVLANGIAIYGGRDNTVSNNIVANRVREGSGLHAGQRFGAKPFAGTLRFTNNTTVRAGSFELNWQIGLGAIWLYALDGSINADVEVTGDDFLQSTYNAILIVSDFGVKDLYSIPNVHFSDIHVDGTGRLGIHQLRPRQQQLLARPLGAAQHHHVRRSPAGRAAAAPVALGRLSEATNWNAALVVLPRGYFPLRSISSIR